MADEEIEREELGNRSIESIFKIDTGHAISPGVWSDDGFVKTEKYPQYMETLERLFDMYLNEISKKIHNPISLEGKAISDKVSPIIQYLKDNGMDIVDYHKLEDVKTIFLLYKNETDYEKICGIDGIVSKLFEKGVDLDKIKYENTGALDERTISKEERTISKEEKYRLTYNALAKMYLSNLKNRIVVLSAQAFFLGRAILWATPGGINKDLPDSVSNAINMGYIAFAFKKET